MRVRGRTPLLNSTTDEPNDVRRIDNCGTELTVAQPPRRIITIKSAAHELLLALGIGDRVIGTAFPDGPVPQELADEASGIPVIADKVPSQEAVLELEPDFVFAGWESNFSIEGVGERPTLAGLGIRTYVAPAACKAPAYMPNPLTFESVFDGFTEAGEVFGAEDAAEELVTEQRGRLDEIVPDDRGLSAVWYSSGRDQPFVGAGIGAPEMIMSAAGLSNVFADVDDWLRFAQGGRLIVDDVDITAPRGQLTALLGPNGAGKSTLLRLIVGALRADSGDAAFDGTTLRRMRRRDRARQVALVEQEWVAADGLTGRDVVALGRVPHQGWFGSHDDDDRVIESSLVRAGATAFAGQDAATLSGGERQRINLARALAQQPSLLLCDEPTNHLDIRAQLDALVLLRDLARGGLAVVTALHDLNHAAAFADRVVVLADGVVRAAGEPAEVLTPDLLYQVWGVEAQVLQRPGSARPLIVFEVVEEPDATSASGRLNAFS